MRGRHNASPCFAPRLAPRAPLPSDGRHGTLACRGIHGRAQHRRRHQVARIQGERGRHACARGRAAKTPRRSRGGRSGKGPRAAHRPEQAPAARPRHAADRSRFAVPRALAARGERNVRRRDPRRRTHYRDWTHRRARMRDRVQRQHDQGRHLLSDDGEKAPARAGDRGREPAAVHLSRRFRRREPSASDRGVSRPRALRPHLLQSGEAFVRRHRADRRGHGLLHRRWRVRAGDVGRNDHRARAGNDLSRRSAPGEGCDRGGCHAPKSLAERMCTPASRVSPTTTRWTISTRSTSAAASWRT